MASPCSDPGVIRKYICLSYISIRNCTWKVNCIQFASRLDIQEESSLWNKSACIINQIIPSDKCRLVCAIMWSHLQEWFAHLYNVILIWLLDVRRELYYIIYMRLKYIASLLYFARGGCIVLIAHERSTAWRILTQIHPYQHGTYLTATPCSLKGLNLRDNSANDPSRLNDGAFKLHVEPAIIPFQGVTNFRESDGQSRERVPQCACNSFPVVWRWWLKCPSSEMLVERLISKVTHIFFTFFPDAYLHFSCYFRNKRLIVAV